MPRFQPKSAHQETPAADAYASNKRGSFPEVEAVAPRFKVSADNQVLVYAKRSFLAPLLFNAIFVLCLALDPAQMWNKLLLSIFFFAMFGILPWFFYDHTVIVLNSATDDAQYFNQTVRSTTRMRIPLSHLQAVRVETSKGQNSVTRRFALNFGHRDMPSSQVYTNGNAAAADVDVIREWLAFHNRTLEQ